MVFLNDAYSNANDSASGSISQIDLQKVLIFTGPLNTFFFCFMTFYQLFDTTALLICTENTFWKISRDGGNFVELFKESFTLYVESGMKKTVEIDIDIFRNERDEISVTKDFNAKFYKFIVGHYLCKFQIVFICT